MLVFVSGLQILVESIKKVLSDFVLNCLSLEMVLSMYILMKYFISVLEQSSFN
jgi:hypothetical protein